jgi:TolB-like protein
MRTMAFFFFILTLAGCVVQESVYTKDGKEYGGTSGLFRDRWWNYYERGLSYAEGDFFEAAVQDFKSAIENRMDDNWRSRTYGMHFIHYFPHRELGTVYYKIKRFDDAARELEYSLKTAESAKARFFLNKTRKSILKQTGNDKLPPSIHIESPHDGAITNKSSITLNAWAEDDFYVSSIRVNDIPMLLELSAQMVTLQQELALKKGVNEITIQASDLTGRTAERVLTIHADRDGPVIIIEDQVRNNNTVMLTGFITDSTRIGSFSINGRSVPLSYEHAGNQRASSDVSGQEAAFRHKIDLPEGTALISIKAADTAGNVTKGELPVHRSISGLDHLPLLASSRPMRTGFKWNEYASAESGPGNSSDNVPPVIHIKNISDITTVYTDSVYLEGRVSDGSRIESIMINGESVLKRIGRKVFFNYLTTLKEGANRFFIQAVDTSGNKSEKMFTVHRKVPKIRRTGSRMSISVLPFERKGKQTIAGDAVYDSLISGFVNQKRFHLIERERIEEILSELRLGQTELVEPGTASRIGEIVVADAILTGTIYESRDAIEVFTRLVDTESSDIVDAQDVFDEDRSLQGIRRLMEGLALKYKQSLPLSEGVVIKKDGKAVLASPGNDEKIKRHMRFILFREGREIKHPLSQKVLSSEPEILGEAKIEKVFKDYSRAIIRKGKASEIRINDKVITK